MKRTVRIFIWITFIFYCLVLFWLLFIDLRVRFTSERISEHFSLSNFIPFKTIYTYIERAASDRMNKGTAVMNILGNLVAFFPLGCYLPCMFKKMRSFIKVILIILGIILTVELLQPILCVGFFDVDDIILNLIGAFIGFLLVSIPPIKTLLQRLHIYS